MLTAGIIGLPNVGKSTLFNALTRSHNAHAANYPFSTIEPNLGVVNIPDPRLDKLAEMMHSPKTIQPAIEFFDIAGLVAGASKGEGLGNQFLSHIREVDAIIHVIRCFENDDIVHQMGSLDPLRDIEIILTELVLADLQSIENQLKRNRRKAKGHDMDAIHHIGLLEKLQIHLNQGKPAVTLHLDDDEKEHMKQFFLLTAKPVIYACNIGENDVLEGFANDYVKQVEAYVAKHHGTKSVVICSKLEEDLGELSVEEEEEFLAELGTPDTGVVQLIRETYKLLDLASFFTENEKEARAWTFRKGMKAIECAGLVHTDFAKGFIKAEVIHFADMIQAGNRHVARDTGKFHIEGKEYPVQDGDVILFRFNL